MSNHTALFVSLVRSRDTENMCAIIASELLNIDGPAIEKTKRHILNKTLSVIMELILRNIIECLMSKAQRVRFAKLSNRNFQRDCLSIIAIKQKRFAVYCA